MARGSIPVNQSTVGTVEEKEFTLSGQDGVVVQDLRPEGKIRCLGGLHEARSESGFLASGSKVTVCGRGPGGQLRVRASAGRKDGNS
ncbi:MAG: hypothetical protein LAT55_08900 [Opitutales bacterium]|nr:hypothetical protein [Opitutales bacterium]